MSSFKLEIHRQNKPVENREFTQSLVTIGRESGDLALGDSEVSSRHGELAFENNILTFTDLGSTNGTFDSTGARVRAPKQLSLGTALRMGKTTLIVSAVGDPPPAQPQVGSGKTMFAPGGVPRPPSRPPAPGASPSLPPPSGSPSRLPPPTGSHAPSPPPTGPHPPVPSSAGTLPPALPGPGPAASTHADTAPPRPTPPPLPAAKLPVPGRGGLPNLPQPEGFTAPRVADPLADTVDEAVVFGGTNPPPRPEGMDPFVEGTAPPLDAGAPAPAFGAGIVAGGQVAASGGVGETLKDGWEFLSAHLMPAAMTFGVVYVGGAAVNLLLGWMGAFVGMLVGLAQLVLGPLAFGALAYLLIKAHLGQPVTAGQAWQAIRKHAGSVWGNMFIAQLVGAIGFVFLIVPGFALTFFMGPAYFVDGKRVFSINTRSAELFMRRIGTILLLLVLLIVVPALVVGVTGTVLAAAGTVGLSIAGFLWAALGAAIMTLFVAISVRMYFELGGDAAVETARINLAKFEGVAPAGGESPPSLE